MNTKSRTVIYALVLLLVAAILAVIFFMTTKVNSSVKWNETADAITVETKAYKLTLNKQNGSITELYNKSSQELLITGNRVQNLWWAFMDNDQSFEAKQAQQIDLIKSTKDKEIVIRYNGDIDVSVYMNFSESDIRLRADVYNGTDKVLESFRFPYELKVKKDNINNGLLPMLPGALLSHAFFEENNSFEAQYPGIMFAPFIAINNQNSAFSLYDVHGDRIEMLDVGFKNQVDDPNAVAIVHNYKTSIGASEKWSSPEIVLQISPDDQFQTMIESYRLANKMDTFPSIESKLGEQLGARLRQPFLKLDVTAQQQFNWQEQKKLVDQLSYASVIHLVGFQEGGHDENYPDFIPASARWGTEQQMKEFIEYAKEKGHAVIPYTNFSWWGVHSPTFKQLPSGVSLEDIAVINKTGTVMKEDYGSHSGYVMNISHPYVRERIAEEHQELLAIGMDGIFEDQWGIRNAPYVYNPATLSNVSPSNQYIEGVKNYFKASGEQFALYTEDGFDVLAKNATGFMGSTLLWDTLGYRSNTSMYTSYYPMIGMLARDKVMLFQHDLAVETMTDDRDMLRWNVTYGYNLSADLFNSANNPWVSLVGVIQSEILSQYGTKRVTNFTEVAPNVLKTEFDGKATVISNWNASDPYSINKEFSIAPSGFDISLQHGNARAGSYHVYNGYSLDPGEHIIVEVQEQDQIKLYQPIGSDTTVAVNKPKKWKYAKASYYTADHQWIVDIPVKLEKNKIVFDFIRNVNDQSTMYVLITESNTSAEQIEVSFAKSIVKENIAKGLKTTVSSIQSEGFSSEKAVDGDYFTYWESVSGRFPQTFTIDLAEVKNISSIVLHLPPQPAWSKREQMIKVLGSEDGKSYREITSQQSIIFDPDSMNQAEIELNTTAKYLQLEFTSNSEWPSAQLSEIEVFE